MAGVEVISLTGFNDTPIIPVDHTTTIPPDDTTIITLNDIINASPDTVGIQDIQKQMDMFKANMDIFFLLTISFIVFFLQAGFAFLEVGSVRSKNATNILIKNMLDVFIGGIAFWLVGYPLGFGEGNGVMGTTHWAAVDLPLGRFAHWCFQFVFAATAATIVSGSVAERCAFNAYFIYSIALTGFIYPVVAHWAWSDDGWLGATSYHDFAGSGVVHLTGGVAALLGAVMLGPRIGRFDKNVEAIRGHSVPLAGLGGFILLFGFLAFNGGSQGSISHPGDAETVAKAVFNTIISGSSGAILVLLINRFWEGHAWSFLLTLNGALTGMVSICSGCDVHLPWTAMLTGLIAGCIYTGLHNLMVKLKIDDPLDAIAVHMGGGLWGLIATPLLMEGGLIHGNPAAVKVLIWNIVGLLAIVGWTGTLCLIMFGLLRVLNMLRVPEEVERKGLDILKHGEPAYPVGAWYEEQYYSKFHGRVDRKNSRIPMNMNPPPPPPAIIPEERLAPSSMSDALSYVPTRWGATGSVPPAAAVRGSHLSSYGGLGYEAAARGNKHRLNNGHSNNAFEMDRL